MWSQGPDIILWFSQILDAAAFSCCLHDRPPLWSVRQPWITTYVWSESVTDIVHDILLGLGKNTDLVLGVCQQVYLLTVQVMISHLVLIIFYLY